ncbi:DUF1570 domain-containing protein [Botrimarina sp.]|uniref:DUF1570 domain-containing protein n=1 Tax=Botrimarina sp. TaxID=2795802 RepID=UPI0032ED598F
MRFAQLRLLRVAVVLAAAVPCAAVDTITFRDRPSPDADPREITAQGRVLIEDSVGNRFFETVDGGRYLIATDDVLSIESNDTPFRPATAEELGERLLDELPGGWRLHTTPHYAVVYDTSREYAEWTSSLMEGLYAALQRYWKQQGAEIEEAEFPLPIVVHRSAADYKQASEADGVGGAAVGYYNLKNNRVRMFDLTGSDELRAAGVAVRRGSRREITRMLATPAAEPLVSTIIHEATHQVCFNTGLMPRLADLPLWYVEGMAVYFEAPGSGGARGWSGIGRVNRRRLVTFLRHLGEWNEGSLASLIASDDRLRDPRTAGVAYADAWALNYYLIHRRRSDYIGYVQAMQQREPLKGPPAGESDAAAARRRIAVFTEHFGDPAELQQEMLQAMSRLRP